MCSFVEFFGFCVAADAWLSLSVFKIFHGSCNGYLCSINVSYFLPLFVIMQLVGEFVFLLPQLIQFFFHLYAYDGLFLFM